MTTNISTSLVVNVNGASLTADQYVDIIDVRVSSSLHSADRLSLRLRDPFFETLDDDVFPYDARIDVSLPDDRGSMIDVFNGTIVGLDVEHGGSDRHELVVVALDDRHILGRSGQVRTFVDRTVSDIVKAVVSDAGLRPSVAAFNTTFASLVQTGSDFEFLNRLALWAGAQWWVDDDVLEFQPNAEGKAVTVEWGDNLQEFSTRTSSAGRPSEVSVRAWDEVTQQALIARAAASKVRDLGTTASIADDVNSTANTGTRVIGTAPFADQTEGNQLATSLMKTATSSVVSLRGACVGEPALRAGGDVVLRSVGQRLAGTWTATEVDHVIGADRPFTTRFVCGGRDSNALVDLVQGTRDSVGPTRPLEPAIGTVSNTKDPDKRGRVKVKFPTLGDDVESPWARVAGLGAGKERGLLIVPQIDDEVFVMFEHGSWRRPVILAGLWSAKNSPPPQADLLDGGNPDKAMILQTGGGHIVELHEGSGEESYIRLTLAGGATELRLSADSVTLKTDKPVDVSSAKDISIESNGGDIDMKASNINLNAKQNVVVKGMKVSVDARGGLELKAAASADLKANGPVTVQSSAITSVKGSLLKLN